MGPVSSTSWIGGELKTLTYGTIEIQNTDPSEIWMPAIVANWEQFDAHIHDGVTSAKLNSVISTAVTTQIAPAGSWGADLGGGRYKQLVTLPIVGGIQVTFDSIEIGVRLSSGVQVYPGIEKFSATSFYVYTTDNSQTYTLIYSV